jgi:superkiller protein 3
MTKPWTDFPELGRWSAENAEVIADILRALRRKKGFGLFFVQCSPAQGTQVIRAIRERFPQKRIVEIELNRESETLYPELRERHQTEGFEIACISGVEQALYSYEDTKRLAGWTAKEIYNYSWKGVPPLLSHLNRQREMFEAHLPIRMVFLVPYFVIDYFIQRAPDFFDWRSGFFRFVESAEELEQACQKLVDVDYEEYLNFTPEERLAKILEIKEKLIMLDLSNDGKRSNLFIEQAQLFESNQDYSKALNCYDDALQVQPDNYDGWNGRGNVLWELQQYEEALISYNHALELQPDNPKAWNNRGNALCDLQRYEEALKSYDSAIELQSDIHDPWINRGSVLCELQRYQEALASYDRALELKPNCKEAWINRGNCLLKMGQQAEAFENLQKALDISGDQAGFLYGKAFFAAILGENEQALEFLAQSIELDPKYKVSARTDLDFAALRDYAVFQEIIK